MISLVISAGKFYKHAQWIVLNKLIFFSSKRQLRHVWKINMMNVMKYFRLKHEYSLVNKKKAIKTTYEIFLSIFLYCSTLLTYSSLCWNLSLLSSSGSKFQNFHNIKLWSFVSKSVQLYLIKLFSLTRKETKTKQGGWSRLLHTTECIFCIPFHFM